MSYLKKRWYLSKTLWGSAIAVAIGILMCVQEFIAAGDFSAAGIVALALGVLSFINRFFTTQGLE